MKFKRFMAANLLLALALSGCGSTESTAAEEQETEAPESGQKMVSPADVTFENKHFGDAVFPIPDDWKIDETEQTYFYAPNSNDIVMLVYHDAGIDTTGQEEQAFKGMESSLMEDIDDYKVEDLTIGGKPAKLFTYDTEARSGKIFKMNLYTFCSGNWMYVFGMGVDDTTEVSYRPIYGYIINHISFEGDQSSTAAAEEQAAEPEPTPVPESVPKEYISALKSAETYSSLMHMSKAGIYDQLTSEYGDKFAADAAQYAIDHIEADWNANALKSAENYSSMMHMSKAGIYDQLISEYGDKFTKSEAQYAVDNVKADWNANALESAKSYRDMMNMSKSAIYDQLISEYGEKFTKSEAQYAIDHLD